MALNIEKTIRYYIDLIRTQMKNFRESNMTNYGFKPSIYTSNTSHQ